MKAAQWIVILAVAAAPAVWAAVPGAQAPTGATYSFSCDGASPLALTPVSFELGVTVESSTGNQGSGAGAGKVISMPLTVKFLMGSDVARLLEVAETGQHFAHCTLTETVRNTGKGAAVATYEYDLSAVTVQSVQPIGSDASNTDSGGTNVPTAYADVAFIYGTMRMLVL